MCNGLPKIKQLEQSQEQNPGPSDSKASAHFALNYIARERKTEGGKEEREINEIMGRKLF